MVCEISVHCCFVVDTVVEVRFHIPSVTCISDAVKEKLLKRVRLIVVHFCHQY